MNNWSHENYPMQPGMGMNMMANGPLLPLPTPMYPMPDVSPMNPPPPVPMHLLNKQPLPDTTNQESENENVVSEYDKNDASARNNERKSRERANNLRRDRDRDRSDFKSKERDYNWRDNGDKQNRNKNRQRDRRSKWDDSDQEATGGMGGTNIQENMMPHPGMGPYQNMLSNMMQSLPGMMMQQPMDQNQMPAMMTPMNMMNSMMPNMMDQNMMMNQQMMAMAGPLIYISIGVILPPAPGTPYPSRREKPNGCRTIFVSSLPKEVTVDVINEIFLRFGPIEEVTSPKKGAFYVRFERPLSVEPTFSLSGYRFKLHNQMENEATTIFIDYALNRDDQSEYEKQRRLREPTPPRVEPFSTAALTNLAEKLKVEDQFPNHAPTLAAWLERGECTKKNANTFYSLIQVSNNQIRRLFNEKVQLDDEFQSIRTGFRDKFAHVLQQLEQVAKILSVAKHQRVSDHFTKQQRRNIDMWLKMTEEVENIKEELQVQFNDDESEKPTKNVVSLEKYEELKTENENLTYELEGYKNEAHLAKDEAERKFETFKAHFIAQQALQNKSQSYPPIPNHSTKQQTPTSESESRATNTPVTPSEAKLISMLTAFLMVHPLGASIDYLTSYVKSLTPNATQVDVQNLLQKYEDVFQRKVSGVGASIDHRWTFATFDIIKESHT